MDLQRRYESVVDTGRWVRLIVDQWVRQRRHLLTERWPPKTQMRDRRVDETTADGRRGVTPPRAQRGKQRGSQCWDLFAVMCKSQGIQLCD